MSEYELKAEEETVKRKRMLYMGSNREERINQPFVHLLLGFSRKSHGHEERCIRSVDKGIGDELEIFESKLKAIGGYWRIHRTVNPRDVEKARKHLICRLINHPEKASYIDSEWRTSLLQPDCVYGEKHFMFDVDTKNKGVMDMLNSEVSEKGALIIGVHESPKGYHVITTPFDTREVCKHEDITLCRDGYYFVKEVNPHLFKSN